MTGLVVALVLAAVAGAALFELAQVLRAGAPREPRLLRLGPAEPAAAAPLPRVVWTFWDTLPAPAVIERCLANWRRLAPDHEIRALDPASALHWLPEGAGGAAWRRLPPYRQADWLRLQLLKAHGGIWMDGSTLLAADLGWVHRLHESLGRGLVGFYIERYTREPARPMLENWFIAAPAGDAFVAAWAAELERALALGEGPYVAALRAAGELDAAAQGIPETMREYLVMHLCAGVVARREPGRHRMALLRAEDVAFAFHAALRWRKRHLYARLALVPAPARPPALVKLRGGDRAVVEKGLARGLWIRGSLLARLLELER
jgi:hypothetical protein